MNRVTDPTLLGGRYRLLDPLGQGGMGTVYAAVQEGLGRRVAVKLLDPRLAEDRQQLERFRREAEVVAALGHPNIVQVTDFQYPDDANPQPFLVMELLRGESLGACVAREQRLPGARVAFIAAQVLSALAAAHRAKVVHRDIKPDNVFLLSDAAIPDTVKVLDFGIAKLAAADAAKLTGTGAMLGTPAFMAPEQARGAEDVDGRADIYGVGASMYQALTGKWPHQASSIPALLFAIVEQTPTPLHELRPDLPLDFVAVVERAMKKNRDERFPDAESMRAALAPWSGLPASTPAPIVSVTAPTVASGPPFAMQPNTHAPVLMSGNRAAAPTPVVPYAPDPRSSWSRNRTLILVVALVVFAIVKVTGYLDDKNRREESRVAQSVAQPPVASSVASEAVSNALRVAMQAVSAIPQPPSPPSPPRPPVITPPARHRYSGDQAFVGTTDFQQCMGKYDDGMFRNEFGLKVAEISACFQVSAFDPPEHQYPFYAVGVNASGDYVSFVPQGDPKNPPALDACLFGVLKRTPLRKLDGGACSFKMGFTARCPTFNCK